MITTLILYLCIGANFDKGIRPTCDSIEVYAVATWEGPSAPQECDEASKRVFAALTPKNALRTRLACESEPVQEELPEPVHTTLRF